MSNQKIVNNTVVRNNVIQEYTRKVFNGTAQNVFACDQETAYFKLSETWTTVDPNGPAIYNTKVVRYLTSLENKYGCAGVCRKAYFYPFSNVENGPPFESCYQYIIDDFSGYTGTYRKYAAAYIVSAFLIFCTWFTAFGVCFRLRWDHRGSPLTLGYIIKKTEDDE